MISVGAAQLMWFVAAMIGLHCFDLVLTRKRKQFRDTWVQWHLAVALVLSLLAGVVLYFGVN